MRDAPAIPIIEKILEKGGTRIVITVLNETKMIDGVESRVVEEVETKDGQLVEITKDYFAISAKTNTVYYMGDGAGAPGFVELIPATPGMDEMFTRYWRASVDWNGEEPIRPFG